MRSRYSVFHSARRGLLALRGLGKTGRTNRKFGVDPMNAEGPSPFSIQDAQTHKHPLRRWLMLGVSFALTVAILIFVFHGIDRQSLFQLWMTQDHSLLAAAAICALIQILLGAERWRAVLSAFLNRQPPLRFSVQVVFYASVFFNCLPVGTVGGDVARIWLARRFALSIKQLVLSVLLDRIITVCALIILTILTLPTIPAAVTRTVWLMCVAVMLSGGAAFFLLKPIARLLTPWRRFRLLDMMLSAALQLHGLTRRGGLSALCIALISAFSGCLAGYCIARSLAIQVGLMQMIAIVSIVSFVTALPISFAGWGVREISFVSLLSLLGVDRAPALLLSVEFGIIATIMSLPGGIVWLALGQRQQSSLGPEPNRSAR